MISRMVVFMSVLTVSLAHPAFPYLWAAPSDPSVTGQNAALVTAQPASRLQNHELRFTALQTVVRSRSVDLSARERTWAENRIEAAGRQVDKKAATDSKGVLRRVSTEFSLDSKALLKKKKKLGAWWSEVVIVHTILANVPSGVRAEELMLLRKKGSSWSEIAYGLGFSLRDFVGAARAECRVAAGRSTADGKVEKLERNPVSDAEIWSEVSWLPEAPPDAPSANTR